jgi:hypothetical protein
MSFRDITVTICLDVELATLETLKGYSHLRFFKVVAKRQELANEFRNAAGVAELASRRGARYVLCEAGFRSPYAAKLCELSGQYGFKVEFIQTGCGESALFWAMGRIIEAANTVSGT